MDKPKIDFEKFKKKALLPKDEITTIFTLDFFSVGLAYFIYKKNLKITPNQITWFRLAFLTPLAIFCLFLAPILQLRIFYLFTAILAYLVMFSDGLDGHLARGADQKSRFGGFLDIISDRVMIILFITFLFSLGMFEKNPFLIYGSIFLFITKIYNMTVINKVFYFGQKNLDTDHIFSGVQELDTMGISMINSWFVKLNKHLKIKRWCEHTGAYERNLITFIIPCVLVFFSLDIIAIIMGYVFVVLFSYFYLSRTKNLILDYKKELSKN
jgi:phosphatidylserine synthase